VKVPVLVTLLEQATAAWDRNPAKDRTQRQRDYMVYCGCLINAGKIEPETLKHIPLVIPKLKYIQESEKPSVVVCYVDEP
jgi:hypothetical protein